MEFAGIRHSGGAAISELEGFGVGVLDARVSGGGKIQGHT